MKQKHQAIIIGHRGARGLAPENTLAGFSKAIDNGVSQIEADARQTSDGVIVLVHNKFLTDQSGKKLKIATSRYAELKAHKPDLATLSESISHINGAVRLMIEIKPGVPTERLIGIVQGFLDNGRQPEDFSFASRNYKILDSVLKALPQIDRVVIDRWSGVRATSRARRLKTKNISMNQIWLWWGFIKSISKNYNLYAYTLNDPKKAHRWEKHGLYGIITDRPDYFL